MFELSLVHEGEFSSTYLAQHTATGVRLLMRSFDKELVFANATAYGRLCHEHDALASLALLPHPFLVRHIVSAQDDDFLYVGMAYVVGGDLQKLLETRGPLPPEHARVYAAEICLAIGHMHSFDILHRDLKPENVLIASDCHVKLGDFASSKRLHGRIDVDHPPPAQDVSLCGTPEYIAPEILLAQPCCETADWWSFGCFVSELLCGRTPFGEPDQQIGDLVRKIIHEDITLPEHGHIGPMESELLHELLRRTPADRLGAREQGGHHAVFASPWFASMTIDSVLRKQQNVAWARDPATTSIFSISGLADTLLGESLEEAAPALELMAESHGQGVHHIIQAPQLPQEVEASSIIVNPIQQPFADWERIEVQIRDDAPDS